ncbi:MAG: hypothetical protein DME04_26480 [Candidatus Rokuibacteriota bacterium]|nr:MAG: hypothetical protein DME04_26480 [Candidatus Rokubacteria bacterium]
MTTVTPENQYLTVCDAARYVGLTEGTIRNQIARGRLPAKKLGRRVLIERLLLDSLIRPHGERSA